jgi:uncharacterized Zn finger protein
MKSTKSYLIKLSVEIVGSSGDGARNVTRVVYAECTCPASKAPFGSCKHLAAFLYALEEFSRCGYTRDLLTSTDELQAWNRSHKKNLSP